MTKEDILKKVDYTILKPEATWSDVQNILNKATIYNCATACIPPYYVGPANYYVNGNLSICTVIGFPNGYSSTEVKCFETKQAILDGASEIDMVINIGLLKDQKYEELSQEIKQIAEICHNHIVRIPLKVIIETCLLTKEEIIKTCEIIAQSGADYIKTSTGFSSEGATLENIKIIKKEIDRLNNDPLIRTLYPDRDKIKIKAAGGIRNYDDAIKFLDAGADRLGTSGLI